MSQVIGKLLPNLNVTLDDNDIEMENSEEDSLEDSENIDNVTKQDVKINSSWMQTFQKPKVYKNATGGFTTGLDLMSEDNVKILEKRAERFGFENESSKCPESVISLYKSLDVPADKSCAKFKSLRLNTVHMRGVEEMSTRDIFSYFKDYGPDSVEWINDYSCNVVWLDESTAARALLRLSKPLPIKQTDPDADIQPSSISNDISLPDITQEHQQDSETVVESHTEIKANIEEHMDKCEENSQISQTFDIPVPPGHWRIGIPYPKANSILLRFATNDDKKKPGSEKRSTYYKKYGNPNYGGLKGLISSSWKRKVQSENNRLAVKSESAESSESATSVKCLLDDDASLVKPRRSKPLRMRMYADDEELITKTLRLNERERPQESVHSRLGTKFTKDDLCQIGRHISPLTRDNLPAYNPREMFRKRSFHQENESDLRGKIKRLKSSSTSKHRSPLCRDD